jgi:hypothetical protein
VITHHHDDDPHAIIGVAAASSVLVAATLGILLETDFDPLRGTIVALLAVVAARRLAREVRRSRDED